MAGENSIDTGIGIGEAQVFHPYQDRGLQGQAAIGIEQDKIARKKAADDELKKKLAGSALDMKGDGLPPALSPVWVKKYTNLNKNIQQGIITGKDKDIDFQNALNGEIANIAQFVPDGKNMATTLHELSKLNIAGELDPESQDSFNKLNDANYWSKRESEGASLPEIAGEYSALLQSVKKRPEVVDWNKELKLGTKGATKEVGRENKETGLKTLTLKLDPNKGMEEAIGRWDAIGAEKQLKYMAQFGVKNSEQAIQNIYNNILASTDSKDINSYDKTSDTGSSFSGNSASYKGIVMRPIQSIAKENKFQGWGDIKSNNYPFKQDVSVNYPFPEVSTVNDKGIVFSYKDKSKLNAPSLFYRDPNLLKDPVKGIAVGVRGDKILVARNITQDAADKILNGDFSGLDIKEFDGNGANLLPLNELNFENPSHVYNIYQQLKDGNTNPSNDKSNIGGMPDFSKY